MQVLKVAIIAYSPTPYRVELLDELSRRGNVRLQVFYVHRHEPGRRWDEKPRKHEAYFLNDSDTLSIAQRQFAEADLCVVSFFSNSAARRLWRARLSTLRPWTFWGEKPGAHQRNCLGKMMRFYRLRYLRRSCADIWAIGEWAAKAWSEEFGTNRTIVNLPYYSDLNRFSTAAAHRERQDFKRRVLFVGELSERKGVDLLLNAFTNLLARYPNLSLTFAGCGSLEKKLQAQATRLNLPAQFIGFVQWDNLPSLYAQHDVLAVPSRYDGWGMVVPEGLASGLPVLASDQTGAAFDLLRPEDNGWIFSAGDLYSLQNCLEKVATLDDSSLLKMSDAAQASVQNHQLRNGAEKFEHLCVRATEKSKIV